MISGASVVSVPGPKVSTYGDIMILQIPSDMICGHPLMSMNVMIAHHSIFIFGISIPFVIIFL
jgi:hypothetical protein